MGRRTLGMVAGFLITHVVAAGDLTLQMYVEADVDAREITLDGMREQIELLKAGADMDRLATASAANQHQVESALATYGVTSGSHAAYGSRNEQAIAAWLATHQKWQDTYNDLATEFKTLSQQLDSLRKGK